MSKKIEELEKSELKIKKEINLILSSLPNIALDEVPVGKDEKSNKEIKKIGEITKLDFKPLSHYEIGEK